MAKTKTNKRIRKNNNKRKTRGGGCGCAKTIGGSKKMKGGFNHSFSTSSLPSDTYIPLNKYNNDPTHMMESVRIQPNLSGGNNNKTKRNLRKTKKTKWRFSFTHTFFS